MRVTITQLDANHIDGEWNSLKSYLSSSDTDLLVLPELPFDQWIYGLKSKDEARLDQSIATHQLWIDRLSELNVPQIIGTHPVKNNDGYHNVAWFWTPSNELTDIHSKYYLPNEEGFWEANWFDRGSKKFEIFETEGFKIGTMICTDMWFMEHARTYGELSAHLVVIPRSTELSTVEKWIGGGKTIGVISGAFSISSNHVGKGTDRTILGGNGWIINPNGDLLARTSTENPFVTVDVDLTAADRAKEEYPRYVKT